MVVTLVAVAPSFRSLSACSCQASVTPRAPSWMTCASASRWAWLLVFLFLLCFAPQCDFHMFITVGPRSGGAPAPRPGVESREVRALRRMCCVSALEEERAAAVRLGAPAAAAVGGARGPMGGPRSRGGCGEEEAGRARPFRRRSGAAWAFSALGAGAVDVPAAGGLSTRRGRRRDVARGTQRERVERCVAVQVGLWRGGGQGPGGCWRRPKIDSGGGWKDSRRAGLAVSRLGATPTQLLGGQHAQRVSRRPASALRSSFDPRSANF